MLALDHVNVEFQDGEFVSIVGTSGSGKSTLLSIVGTLDSPTDGQLLFNEKNTKQLSQKQLADFRFENIGFIFQQFHLLPTLTALENVMSPLFARNVSYNKRKRAEEVLTKVGLIDKSNSLPSQLSGGQQQRVAIARALIHEPKWLLADEPTGNLDTENSEISTSLFRFIMIGLFGLMIYWLGTIIPAFLVRKIKTYETMKSGEISSVGKRWLPSRSIWTMSLQYLIGKWKRSLLFVISISLPTALFIVFLFVTFRLKGVMYATWLGQYVAMEVSSLHYIAMGVALLIAILTTTEIIWQNVSERQPEIALLKSVGWHNRSIYWLVLLEGVFSGLFAGIIGIAVAFFFVWRIYGVFPTDQLVFFLLAIFIPILTGMLGAVIPASKAMKIQPYQGLSGTAEYSKKTEKQFRVTLIATSAILFVGLLTLLANAIPEMKESTAVPVDTSQVVTTEGKTTKKIDIPANDTNPNEKNNEIPESLQSYYDEAWKTIKLGDTIKASIIQSIKRSDVSIKETPAKHMKYVSITIDIKNGKKEDDYINLKPVGYKMVDADGKEYEPIDIEIPKKKNWNGLRLSPGGHVQFKVIFEVPDNKKPMVMIYLTSYEPGPLLVEI